MTYNIHKIRSFFPVLKETVYDKPLVYLDSAASAQKPLQVLKAEKMLHKAYYGNIHRATHFMAGKATADFETVREKIRDFIHAGSTREIIFTKGTTESINLVATTFGDRFLKKGDEIIVSEMEHHSNIVPWQLATEKKGANIVKLPFNDNGTLQIERLPELISKKTKLIAVSHVSNVLGTINPIETIVKIAHDKNIPVLVDGAQAVPHIPIDVSALDVDFYAFSAHKMYGPNGVGILYGKEDWLNKLPPYQGGGEMIAEVSFERTTYNELPYKFEAGTPNITGVIAFGAALDLISATGIDNISKWEHLLLDYATKKLEEIPGLRIYGRSNQKSGVISFNIDKIHSYDLGLLLDKSGIAVRTGHMCADTVMQHYEVPGMVRISFGMYNKTEEIVMFLETLNKIIRLLM
ncbi:MAG: cysteine desulfurase CsdA [Draconibacterium sp.]|nr:MAG: cysteine desulfurase CsdA [Draconibacterium sp.]